MWQPDPTGQNLFDDSGPTSVWFSFQLLLVGTGFTQQNEEQYFQFLAKFEIALPVANNR